MKLHRPNIKINKTWLMLIAAIVLSLLTTWLALQYLQFKEKSIEEEVTARSRKSSGATISVVVPIRSLPPGAMLDESVVASRSVPADFVYDDTITVAQFEAFKGNALIRAVQQGKPLRKADVREIFADFSGTLKVGKRAMTINVDEINSVSHMVEPGNLVDLMLVITAEGTGSASQAVVPFLEQIKVLATGQKVTHDDPALEASAEGRRTSYSTFTLEVTPTQAARLTLAGELGKIRAVLRNENDQAELGYDAVNASNLLDDIHERTQRAAKTRPGSRNSSGYIEYIIGGKGGGDAVAPAINIPLPPGISLTPPSLQASAPATNVQAGAGGANVMPQNMQQLIQLGLANDPRTATPSK